MAKSDVYCNVAMNLDEFELENVRSINQVSTFGWSQ